MSDDDRRWIVVDGKRWRATDPSIPEPFRKELVAVLMDARRGVSAATRTSDDAALRRARERVHDAKVALGERGQPWWEAPSDEGRVARIDATMLTLARHRAPDRTICPSDVARAIGGESWRALMPLVRDRARSLARKGDVVVLQRGEPVDLNAEWKGPLRIRYERERDHASSAEATASTT